MSVVLKILIASFLGSFCVPVCFLEAITEVEVAGRTAEEEQELRQYYKDIKRKLRTVDDVQERKDLTRLLADGLSDESDFIYQHAMIWLNRLNRGDFDEETIRIISEHEPRPGDAFGHILLLGGIGATEKLVQADRDIYKHEFVDPWAGTWRGSEEWATLLALARNGDAVAEKVIIDQVSRQDTKTIVVWLLDHLAYTKQPESIKFIEELVFSDEVIKGGGVPMRVASEAARRLSLVRQDFPLKRNSLYSSEDILFLRDWITKERNSSGENSNKVDSHADAEPAQQALDEKISGVKRGHSVYIDIKDLHHESVYSCLDYGEEFTNRAGEWSVSRDQSWELPSGFVHQ